MRFVSPLLKNVIYPALHQTRVLRSIAPSSGCVVVNYHGVSPLDHGSRDAFLDGNLVSQEAFRKQLKFLNSDYEVITPDDCRSWLQTGKALPPGSVLVTCDDGLLNNLLDMLPVLQGEGIQCLFFVTGASCLEDPGMLWYEELYLILGSGQLGRDDLQVLFEGQKEDGTADDFQSLWWGAAIRASRCERREREQRLQELREQHPIDESQLSRRRWRLLNVHELRKLAQSGMTIGAHSMSHPVLSQCDDAESFREISESKIALEQALAQPVWAFAYPFGNPATIGEREADLARKAGFECAFLNAGGGPADRFQKFKLSRTHISSEMTVAELEAHMIGFHARLQNVVRG